jgi:hypothetical protein
MPVKPLETAATHLKYCDSLWSEVYMCALIKVDDILRTRLICDVIPNKISSFEIGKVYCKFITSAVIKILHS